MHIRSALENCPEEELMYMLKKDFGWRYKVKISGEQEKCKHQWEFNKPIVRHHFRCTYCSNTTNINMRIHCVICKITACPLCSKFYLDIEIKKELTLLQFQLKDSLIHELIKYVDHLIEENRRLKEKLQTEEDMQLEKSFNELSLHDREKGKIIIEEDEEDLSQFIEEASGAKVLCETVKEQAQRNPRRMFNKLYNVAVTFEIAGVERFQLKVTIDTDATTCCANINNIPKEAIEELNYQVKFSGVNSTTEAAGY